jgi:hypothetical protein
MNDVYVVHYFAFIAKIALLARNSKNACAVRIIEGERQLIGLSRQRFVPSDWNRSD